MGAKLAIAVGLLGFFGVASSWSAEMPAGEAPSQSAIVDALKPRDAIVTRGLPRTGVAGNPESRPNVASPSAPVAGPSAVSQERPSYGFESIQFEFGSAKLKPESAATLRNLGNALNQELRDQSLFQIEGHTDSIGSASYNMELSRRRAQSVKDFLVRQMRVSPRRLNTVGKGFSEPLDKSEPQSPKNRRVVVVNLTG